MRQLGSYLLGVLLTPPLPRSLWLIIAAETLR